MCRSGTNTSVALKSSLPDPHNPLTYQVSWTWTSRTGMQTCTTSGPWAVILGFPFSMTRQPAQTHALCVIPLANGQRPLTRTPPSARTAAPAGAAIPADGAVGSANTSRAPGSFM